MATLITRSVELWKWFSLMKHDYPYNVMHLQSLIFSYIRAYTSYCPSQDIEDSVISTVTFFLDSLGLKAVTRERVRAATATDSSMNTLVGHWIRHAWVASWVTRIFALFSIQGWLLHCRWCHFLQGQRRCSIFAQTRSVVRLELILCHVYEFKGSSISTLAWYCSCCYTS